MENLLNELIGQYLLPACGAALVAIFGWVGKKIVNYLKVKQLDRIAKNAVEAAEQTYKDLHGEEKLDKALYIFSKMALSKGIKISTEEMKFYIEAAVGEFNNVFKQDSKSEYIENISSEEMTAPTLTEEEINNVMEGMDADNLISSDEE